MKWEIILIELLQNICSKKMSLKKWLLLVHNFIQTQDYKCRTNNAYKSTSPTYIPG